MKLAGIGQPPIYSALLGAQCASIPGAIAVNQQGNATFTLATGAGFPLSRPFATAGNCGGDSAVVAQLSADGSTFGLLHVSGDVRGVAAGGSAGQHCLPGREFGRLGCDSKAPSARGQYPDPLNAPQTRVFPMLRVNFRLLLHMALHCVQGVRLTESRPGEPVKRHEGETDGRHAEAV